MRILLRQALLFLICCCISSPLLAELRGKIDLGPTFLDVDILESGKTVETLYMKALKGDANILVGLAGLCVKPGFIVGTGHGDIASFSIGIGHYTPITKKFSLLPSIGVTFSYLRTRVSFEELGLFHLKERFRSISPFLGLEFSYALSEKWTLVGLFQYAWSRTHTKISPIISDKSHSNGPNYSLGLDYSLNKNWSLTFGVGYNITLSKEKHGIRGKGAKLGLAYYF
ncbi:outer membrane beta-barrel protein [Candidatus Protochlamydia phocaeensis]|uniref:outer membrane beta-barrel protein n=1 Tax=Candidatus Protochlamydia phocaeensis TaxID=1414722 RepID=UPI000839949C|nr:outer membrane beta-barrel protein [Candidatus Protochlamydia phocaeensis]